MTTSKLPEGVGAVRGVVHAAIRYSARRERRMVGKGTGNSERGNYKGEKSEREREGE
jgi:hypothetical protein